MSISVKGETAEPSAFRQRLDIGAHQIFSDIDYGGGGSSAPSPHGLFDASLAACKALTAHWYARQHNYPLERVSTVIDRDNTHERTGQYALTVTMTFHGDQLTDEQRAKMLDIASRCPVHKLMTTTDVIIETKLG